MIRLFTNLVENKFKKDDSLVFFKRIKQLNKKLKNRIRARLLLDHHCRLLKSIKKYRFLVKYKDRIISYHLHTFIFFAGFYFEIHCVIYLTDMSYSITKTKIFYRHKELGSKREPIRNHTSYGDYFDYFDYFRDLLKGVQIKSDPFLIDSMIHYIQIAILKFMIYNSLKYLYLQSRRTKYPRDIIRHIHQIMIDEVNSIPKDNLKKIYKTLPQSVNIAKAKANLKAKAKANLKAKYVVHERFCVRPGNN